MKFRKLYRELEAKKPKRNRKETGTISVSVNERYSGFGSVSVFLNVTTLGYGSVSVSLKNGRKTGFSVSVRLTGRFLYLPELTLRNLARWFESEAMIIDNLKSLMTDHR